MAVFYTQVGEELVTDFTTGDAAAPANYYVGWGTGAGAPGKGSVDVSGPGADELRIVAVESQPVADRAQWVATITCLVNPKTITNAGLFNTAGGGPPPAGGIILVHGDHAGIALAVGDKIEYTISLEQT